MWWWTWESDPALMSKARSGVRRTGDIRSSRRKVTAMRFMGFVQMQEGIGAPPQALIDAMDVFIGEAVAAGQFLDGGGLYGTEDAVNFVIRMGETTRGDGPYSEGKEGIGGYSGVGVASPGDAVEEARGGGGLDHQAP